MRWLKIKINCTGPTNQTQGWGKDEAAATLIGGKEATLGFLRAS